jgi:O-acetylhomoserine/O-acetylserine sulfhydrylase
MTTFVLNYENIAADSIHKYSENLSDLLIDKSERNTEDPVKSTLSEDPIVAYYEQKIAEKEKGKEALAFTSLKELRSLLFNKLLRHGDNIVTFNSYELYLEYKTDPNAGIDVRLSADGELTTFKSLVDKNTKFIYLETVSKEYINIPDFYKIISFAKEKEIPVIVDNTSGGSGYFIKPVELGAHIVLENTNEWLHEDYNFFNAFIIEGNTFDWIRKFPHLKPEDLIEDYSSYPKSISWGSQPPPEFYSVLYYLKSYRISKTLNKFQTYHSQLIESIISSEEKVLLRSKTALALSLWLKSKEYINKIDYTGLPENKSYFNALRYFSHGFGNKLSFQFKEFIDAKRFFKILGKSILVKNSIFYNEEKKSIHISIPAITEPEIISLFENVYNEYLSEIDPYTVSSERIII